MRQLELPPGASFRLVFFAPELSYPTTLGFFPSAKEAARAARSRMGDRACWVRLSAPRLGWRTRHWFMHCYEISVSGGRRREGRT